MNLGPGSSPNWVVNPKTRTDFPGGNSEREPPDPIPNSEVKTLSADGSVGSPHVRVGHRQALNRKAHPQKGWAFCFGMVVWM